MNPDNLSPSGKKFFCRVEFDQNEVLIREVRKHPFGLFLILAGGILGFIATVLVLIVGGATYNFDGIREIFGLSTSSMQALTVSVGFFMAVFVVLLTTVAAYLYTNNVVLVTSEKITQQLYLSLFNRKISQLSIADVQDVTVRQQGIFAHIFNYGTLTIETAGEQSNYTFTFTPDPYEVGKDLVGAHERDAAIHGN